MQEKPPSEKEKILNVPNVLTFLRVVLTFVTIFFIFAGFPIVVIAITFIVGMLTDFFDGQIARRFKLTTEFGRQFDVIADRFLMGGTALAIIVAFSLTGDMTRLQLLQVFLIMTREILAFPFALLPIIAGKGIPKVPHVRFVGKLTTFLQGVTFPAIILSIFYPVFSFSLYLAILTSVVGAVAAFYFMIDMRKATSNT